MQLSDDIISEFTQLCGKGAFWRAFIAPETVRRALKVAALVGAVLVAINQGDILLNGQLPPIWKLVLTFCVPYLVSSYSAAAFKVALAKRAFCPSCLVKLDTNVMQNPT